MEEQMGSRERKIILIIALIVAAAVIAAVCIYTSPDAFPAEETAAASPAAATPAPRTDADGSIVISELMEKNRAVVRDEDGDFSDWIELHNVSGKAVSLGGWRISDKSGDLGNRKLCIFQIMSCFLDTMDINIFTDGIAGDLFEQPAHIIFT